MTTESEKQIHTSSDAAQALLPLPQWHYLNGRPVASGQFKSCPEDFRVTELMDWQPSGDGEHLWMQIRKSGINTADLCQKLASAFGVHRGAVGYAGLKDKHSVAEQWVSVQLPGKQIDDPAAYLPPEVSLLSFARHDKKLRTGANRGNQFEITLRQVSDPAAVEKRLQQVAVQGVPNYFGEQRFGFDGNNIRLAQRLFDGRKLSRNRRSMALSAARSYLFNQVVSERLAQGLFDTALDGEAFLLAGSNAFFAEPALSGALQERIEQGDLLLSAPLWGKGDLPSLNAALAFEEQALQGTQVFQEGLARAGLRQERRALLLRPEGFNWEWQQEDQLRLSFSLPKGCFATAVLREIIVTEQPEKEQGATKDENSSE